jgi:FKBP-type peptidyl-prolyl cis-trans isomerase
VTPPPAEKPPAEKPPAETGEMTTTAPADVAAPPADAQKTPSGLAWKHLKKVDGARKPNAWDGVTVHYVGWTTDGKKFDASLDRGQPTSFPLNQVIAGWTEGLQLIGIGERARFWIPQDLAYKGQPGPPAGMLVFDVELLSIEPGTPPIPAPADVAAPPADAQTTPGGVAWKVITPGTGTEKPTATSRVTVHYTGWTTDGKMFDSSVQRGQPASFPLDQVIPGWTEGLQQLTVGTKARLWIPEALAYKGQPGRPAGMLVFEVELQSFVTPPAAPADVAAPPADAKKTASGLAWKVLTPGDAKGQKPTATNTVKVHYSGWTTDGKMFDSSVMRGEPSSFRLDQVIAGWTEGLQLLTPGTKARLWIPENLAYGGRPGKPAGMLVFDVELLGVE